MARYAGAQYIFSRHDQLAGIPQKADHFFGAAEAANAVTLVIFWSLPIGCRWDHGVFVAPAASRHSSWRSLSSLRDRIRGLCPDHVFHRPRLSRFHDSHHSGAAYRRPFDDQPWNYWHLHRADLSGS